MATDYFEAGTVIESIAYKTGQGVSVVESVATHTINPFVGGLAVGLAWGAIRAAFNYRSYKRGRMSGKCAIENTAYEGATMGVAAGLGLSVSNVVRTSFLAASMPTLVPFTVGVVTTGALMNVWNLSWGVIREKRGGCLISKAIAGPVATPDRTVEITA